MSIKATRTESGLEFRHYSVRRKGKSYWAVENDWGAEITSGPSLGSAAKKAKLLERGYMDCRDDLGLNDEP